MKRSWQWFFCWGLTWVLGQASDDYFDQLSDRLSGSFANGKVVGKVSAVLDLEVYAPAPPPSSLIYTDRDFLVTPRVSVFLDAQAGDRVYFFSQARLDRGFDPADRSLTARIDEMAIRVALREDATLNLQVGQFASVIGSWIPRHGSWTNPFVTAPLLYENLTGIWDSAAPRSSDVLLGWSHVKPTSVSEYADKHLRLPVVWGASYTTGAALSGSWRKFEYVVECKNAALSSRPDSWRPSRGSWRHPSIGGRLGYRPNVMWNVGASASEGVYLLAEAERTIPPRYRLGDYRQRLLAQDTSFAWRRWQLWFEVAKAWFEIPPVGTVDTTTGFVEVKCKVTPQWALAARANRQIFSHLVDRDGRSWTWGRNLWRYDVASIYRISAHLQTKLQYSYQTEEGPRGMDSHLWAGQLSLRF